MAERPRQTWTAEEDAKLREMLAQDARPKDIAAAVGKTSQAVTSRIKQFRQAKPAVTAGPWTDDDQFVADLMRRIGRTWEDVGEVLGRSANALKSRKSRSGADDFPCEPPPRRRTNGGYSWSEDDDLLLLELVKRRWYVDRIAAFVDRSPTATATRMHRLGLDSGWNEHRRKPEGRRRPCMCCQRTFMSEGIHNRLCLQCKNSDLMD